MEYGLDLSKHNGTVDFNSIKNAGNSFVILRAGYGNTVSQKDSKFEEYYTQAKAAGLKVGTYWYSYALTSSEATTEAKAFLEAIKGKQFEYPVYIDMEDADQYKKKHGMPSNQTLCDICNNFCSYVESQGYYVGIYASESWFNNQLKNVSNSYDKWLASWGSNNGQLNSDKSAAYQLHQFTSKYSLNGKTFDRNVSYYDYESVIKSKGLNGYSANSSSSSSSNAGTSAMCLEVTYQTWDDVKNKWLPNVVNNSDYAGIFGHDVCCVYANANVGNVYYQVHYKNGKWLPEVANRSDYAGLYNKPIDGFMIKSDTRQLKYRVHLRSKNKWLPYVTGYSTSDSNNGYAGIIGQEIDAIEILPA